MRTLSRLLAVALALVALTLPSTAAAVPPSADEATATFDYTQNMHPLGFSAREIPLANAEPGAGVFNSDLAFWGRLAVQGTYAGFRIIDVSAPANPREIINYTGCTSPTSTVGNQGDVLVWGDLLIRSWNSPVSAANAATASCGGELVGQGFEGLNIFDISDPVNPVLVKNLRMAADTTPTGCGSHTATLVPDVANGNLYVYNNASSRACPGIDIVRIPLDDPQNAEFLHRVPTAAHATTPGSSSATRCWLRAREATASRSSA